LLTLLIEACAVRALTLVLITDMDYLLQEG